MALLTQFTPIFCLKSDGHETVTTKGLVTKNAPSAQQLDQTPNEQGQADYYRPIDKDEPKHIDWRKKLGGMLLREIGGKAHEGGKTGAIMSLRGVGLIERRQMDAVHTLRPP